MRIEELNATSTRLDNARLSEDDLLQSQIAHSALLQLVPRFADLVQYKRGSRGIVTVAGGMYSQALIVSIRMLRRTKCRLPIEVFIPEENKDGKNEFDAYTCNVVLKELNARCVRLPKLANIALARYSYKSVALLFSDFEDTLFIDADIFPLVDPAKFFRTESYTSTGLLTWPDFWASTTSPLYYQLIGQDAPSIFEHASTEAGAMVISRRKHAETLLLAFYYNIYGPGFFYELLSQHGIGGEGDKETWIAAARALHKPYYQVRERNHALVWAEDETELDEITAMVQYDPIEDFRLSIREGENISSSRNRPEAKIVFVHANRIKTDPAGVMKKLDELHGLRRIWGPKEKTLKRFGYDLEAVLWKETIHVACYDGRVLLEVADSKRLCEDLRRFWWRILMEEELDARVLKQMRKDEELRRRAGEGGDS